MARSVAPVRRARRQCLALRGRGGAEGRLEGKDGRLEGKDDTAAVAVNEARSAVCACASLQSLLPCHTSNSERCHGVNADDPALIASTGGPRHSPDIRCGTSVWEPSLAFGRGLCSRPCAGVKIARGPGAGCLSTLGGPLRAILGRSMCGLCGRCHRRHLRRHRSHESEPLWNDAATSIFGVLMQSWLPQHQAVLGRRPSDGFERFMSSLVGRTSSRKSGRSHNGAGISARVSHSPGCVGHRPPSTEASQVWPTQDRASSVGGAGTAFSSPLFFFGDPEIERNFSKSQALQIERRPPSDGDPQARASFDMAFDGVGGASQYLVGAESDLGCGGISCGPGSDGKSPCA